MSKTEQPRYIAIITLSLPGGENKVTANVTLSPAETIPTPGGGKLLRDCTVADLRAYAAELEKEAWHTYREITLLELNEQEELELSLTFVDESGSAVPESTAMMEQVVLMPAQPTGSEAAVVKEIPVEDANAATEKTAAPPADAAAGESAVTDTAAAPEEPAAEEETGGEMTAPPVPPELETIPVEDGEPRIVVAAPEAIFAEREAGVDERITGEDGTQFAPSKARVRVAGKRRAPDRFSRAAVDIFIEEPALRGAQAHALTSLNREVAGVLVGPRPEKQPDGSYIVQIIDTIIAKHTVMQGASVTYTPESWRYMNDKLHERYPDETAVIVGWYHTHPGFGIFLSGMDLFIHQNFFTQIWHVAYVLDPRAKTSGFFCWNREKTEVSRVDFPWPHWAPGSW